MNEPSVIENTPAVEELNYDSNLILGLAAGGVAMLLSAALWGVITFVTNFQISWMAIGVGAFVGFAIQKFGKGKTLIYGLSGGIFSLVGCMLGNFFFYNGILAREWGLPFFDVLMAISQQPDAIVEIFIAAFDFMDLIFYGVAAYIGFSIAMGRSK